MERLRDSKAVGWRLVHNQTKGRGSLLFYILSCLEPFWTPSEVLVKTCSFVRPRVSFKSHWYIASMVLALGPNRLSPPKQNVLFCPLPSDLRTCWHLILPSLILSSSHCSTHGSGSAWPHLLWKAFRAVSLPTPLPILGWGFPLCYHGSSA